MMERNVEMILEREERLEALQARSDELQAATGVFRKARERERENVPYVHPERSPSDSACGSSARARAGSSAGTS